MIVVDNIPQDLLEDLTGFSDWFFQQDRAGFKITGNVAEMERCTSKEYLLEQQTKQLVGFPAKACGIDFQQLDGWDLDAFYPKVSATDSSIKSYIGSKSCAIKMYYPEGGYIDWHTNENAYGYNVLFTYSMTGDGAFIYQNPKTKEIVTLPDQKGWNMKIGLYDQHGGMPLWHSAYTKCERLTWGYIVDQRSWDVLVSEIDVDLSPLTEMYGQLPSYISN
jgi:hypothetical protein